MAITIESKNIGPIIHEFSCITRIKTKSINVNQSIQSVTRIICMVVKDESNTVTNLTRL